MSTLYTADVAHMYEKMMKICGLLRGPQLTLLEEETNILVN
jgi:hypothetical protein